MKRRQVKRKEKKKRYSHLNADFQRIARRDKKPFLSDQCKETEENNRMGNIRDLFQKIRDTKGIFNAKNELSNSKVNEKSINTPNGAIKNTSPF